MSLINDALRKARQAASEHDAKQAEDLFRPRKAYPSRRSHGRGWLTMALIAVVAGVVGAAAAWWFVGQQRSAPAEAAVDQIPLNTAASVIATPEIAPTPTQAPITSEPSEVQVVEAPPVPSPHAMRPQAEVEPEAQPPVREPPPTATTAAPGERVYVMEADLGDVVLSLDYIVARQANPFAEINGIVVYLGSEIEGFVVESIEANRVVLRDDKGPLVLRVP